MSRMLLAGVIVSLSLPVCTLADEETPSAKTGSQKADLKQAVVDNPEDAKALLNFLNDRLRRLNSLSTTEPDEAEKAIKEIRAFLGTLSPKNKDAKRYVSAGKNALASIQRRIALGRMTFDEIKAKLNQNPDDLRSLQNFVSKQAMTIGPIARKEYLKAEKQLSEGLAYLESLGGKTKQDRTKEVINKAVESLSRYQRTIDSAKRHVALQDTQAADLDVETWINGSPLTKESLKGKVVMLDFGAVWCGPCIATFPHLREWTQKHKDLEIIGITKYYNYAWDAEAKRGRRQEDDVPKEVEQDMLAEFVKHHKLTHRFAFQDETKMSEFYGVTSIPQVVLIDREGKIRLIRVGAGTETTQEIETAIEKLISE